jgi:hypothetical protein
MIEEAFSEQIGLFDLDGSLADYEGAMKGQLELLKSPGEPEIDLWSEEPYMEARRDLIARQPYFWSALKPLAGGFEILKMAESIGFRNEIVTKGPRTKSRAWMEKLDWCANYLPPKTDVHITLNKSRLWGKFLYDDFPDYMEDWLKWHPRGLGIMPLLPRNADFKHPRCLHWDGTNHEQIRDALVKCFNRKPGKELVL